MLRVLGKAGAARWRGVRPTVRGTTMKSRVDRHMVVVKVVAFRKRPVTPWGVQTKGKRPAATERTDNSSYVAVANNFRG
ncbi:hypothetical protein ACLK19_22185 [Escherichia coli]